MTGDGWRYVLRGMTPLHARFKARAYLGLAATSDHLGVPVGGIVGSRVDVDTERVS
jgi:hypothetical protein